VSPLLPRRAALAVVLTILTASSGVSWWIGARITTPAQAAQEALPPPPSLISVEVEKRPLTREIILDMDVQPSGTFVVTLPSNSDDVVTSVHAPLGTVVQPGDLLLEHSGRPLIALPGAFPMYRDLSVEMAGPDVAQLQRSLRAGGFRIPRSEADFGPATTAATRSLYRRAGYPVAAGVSPTVNRHDIAFVPQLPATVVASNARVGRASDGIAITLGFGESRLRGLAPLTDDGLLKPGLPVTIESAEATVAGQVADVGAVTAEEGRNARPVTVTPASELDPGRYRVTILLSGDQSDHLVVPTSALFMANQREITVRVLRAETTVTAVVDVLLIAEGYAAIRPRMGEVSPGDRVIIGAANAAEIGAN
jgi:multidrug efflux pump subunit AcrA (membrane-fusion protein)